MLERSKLWFWKVKQIALGKTHWKCLEPTLFGSQTSVFHHTRSSVLTLVQSDSASVSLGNATLAHPRPRVQRLQFNKIPRWFLSTTKVEKQRGSNTTVGLVCSIYGKGSVYDQVQREAGQYWLGLWKSALSVLRERGLLPCIMEWSGEPWGWVRTGPWVRNDMAHTIWSFGQCPVVDRTWDLEAHNPCLNLNPPCIVLADTAQACTSVSSFIQCGGSTPFMEWWWGFIKTWNRLAHNWLNMCSMKSFAHSLGEAGGLLRECGRSQSFPQFLLLPIGKVFAWSGGWMPSCRAVLLKG